MLLSIIKKWSWDICGVILEITKLTVSIQNPFPAQIPLSVYTTRCEADVVLGT